MKKSDSPTNSTASAAADVIPIKIPKPHVKWDEETIAAHDRERGTRMKIDEPNTPYHYYNDEDDLDDQIHRGAVSPARSLSGKESDPPIEWNELNAKLQRVHDANQRINEWDNSDGEDTIDNSSSPYSTRDAEGKKIVKDPKFTEKRKAHYNEFEAMRKWKQQHASDEDKDEEEDDDDEDEGTKK